MLYAKLGDSNAAKKPNELSFNNVKIRLYNPTFCYEAKSGKDKPPRRLKESTRKRHDGLTGNLIVILRISVITIVEVTLAGNGRGGGGLGGWGDFILCENRLFCSW